MNVKRQPKETTSGRSCKQGEVSKEVMTSQESSNNDLSILFKNGRKPNLLLIITDQERHMQHWPNDFTSKHLPALARLQDSGLTFEYAYTGSCMCSPSRATFVTSQYPPTTGVTTTGSPEPKHHLPTDIPNLATVLQQFGYRSAWRGKWHLGGTPADYGFEGWVPPDAGNYLSLNDTLGGGTPNNDGRFLQECYDFLEQQDPHNGPPFCLVASFVNPHDVYVAEYEIQPELGYTQDDFHRIEVPLPTNCQEDLDGNNKPRAQVGFSWPHVTHDYSMQEYVNFYAYLHTVVDKQIEQLLSKFDSLQLADQTLIIRFADHGEQALSHGLVEKFYNAYEESIRIPFIFSNPKIWPKSKTTKALASSVDLLPTITSLLLQYGNYGPVLQQSTFQRLFKGCDLSPVLVNPSYKVQSAIHFTYDDIESRTGPSIIRCLRSSSLKYSVYFDKSGHHADWELYDLQNDPDENVNLAGNPDYIKLQTDMDIQLYKLMLEKGTMPTTFEWPPKGTKSSIGRLELPPSMKKPTPVTASLTSDIKNGII